LRQDLSGARQDLKKGRGPAGMPRFVLGGFVLLQVVALAGGVLMLGSARGAIGAEPERPAASAAAASVAPATTPPPPAEPLASASPSPAAASGKTAERKAPATASKVTAKAAGIETAPTCEQLLGKRPAIPGSYPGAAHNELRAARRALVRGDLDEAQRCYCRAARYDERLTDAAIGLARLLLIRRDPAAAADWAKKASKIDPGSGDVQFVLGDALALSGDASGARTALLAAAGVRENEEPSVLALARRMVQLGHEGLRRRDYANAERYFRRASVLDPRNWEGPYGAARALLEMDRAALAVGFARQALELGEHPRTHVLLGDALNAAGDTAAAETQWRKAYDMDPRDPEARFRIGRLASK
jgi:tetratricopeptide (TPR) repeat protein